MSENTGGDVTRLLLRWRDGDREALDELMPLMRGELRRLARARLRGERAGISLQPTELVPEAYLRLMGQKRVAWRDRVHFLAVAGRMMRRILVDRARRRGARGGNAHVSLDSKIAVGGPTSTSWQSTRRFGISRSSIPGRPRW